MRFTLSRDITWPQVLPVRVIGATYHFRTRAQVLDSRSIRRCLSSRRWIRAQVWPSKYTNATSGLLDPRSSDEQVAILRFIALDLGSSLAKYSIYCIALNRIPRSYFRILDPRSNSQLAMLGGIRVPYSPRLLDQGSSFLKYLPQQSRHKNCEHDPQFHRRFHKYQLPKLYHLGNPININTWTNINIHIQNVILLLHN